MNKHCVRFSVLELGPSVHRRGFRVKPARSELAIQEHGQGGEQEPKKKPLGIGVQNAWLGQSWSGGPGAESGVSLSAEGRGGDQLEVGCRAGVGLEGRL